MRLDKFLKVSRLIKRRTIAKEVCDAGKISVNGRVAKAGTVLAVGDHLDIQFGEKLLSVEVLRLDSVVKAGDADTLYRVL